MLIIAALSGWAVLDGAISIGQLVTVVGLAQFLQSPMMAIGIFLGMFARARASHSRVEGVLSLPRHERTPAPKVSQGLIEMNAVSAENLRDLSLTIEPGEHVAVVADDRDAMVLERILGGHLTPTTGEIRVDGAPLGRPAADDDLAIIAAPHHAAVLSGTVSENVGETDPERRDAIAAATALDDVVRIAGWEREVGERGRRLSGGQRQRVALARALAADPAILILREPTTSIDAVTETRIARGIRRYRQGKTTVIITHSPTLHGVCDRVVRVPASAGPPPPDTSTEEGDR